jgi:hypothetical protein
MHVQCPHCERDVSQAENRDGPNFCPACRRLFYLPEERKTPPWTLGVLTILAANWQIMSR